MSGYFVHTEAPRFSINGTQFAVITPELVDGPGVIVVYNNQGNWQMWDQTETHGCVIEPNLNSIVIGRHGTVRQYLVWVMAEARRRAQLFAHLPPPNPNNVTERVMWYMLTQVKNDSLEVAPSPLPYSPGASST